MDQHILPTSFLLPFLPLYLSIWWAHLFPQLYPSPLDEYIIYLHLLSDVSPKFHTHISNTLQNVFAWIHLLHITPDS